MDDIFNFETKEEINQPEQEAQETSGTVPEMDFDLMEPFPEHKFKLYTGQRLEDMVESIREFGILEPLILWKHEDRFTILSGHNRVNAARLAGLTKGPVVIREELSYEDAVLIVTETNLRQRSFDDLSPSEKAFCLKQHYYNREYLKDVVHKDIPGTDITAVLRVMCGKDQEKGNASFMVKESMLEMWGVEGEDLYEQAVKNTERLLPPRMLNFESILSLEDDESMKSKKLEPYAQYVLTNDVKIHGATAMLYPGLLQEIGEATGGSFFILPSSIHETILIKDNGEMSAEEFQRMVIEVNRIQVRPEEVLSDEVYSYDYQEQKLTMATDPAQTKEYVEQMSAEYGCGDSTEEAESGEMER